MNNIFQREKDGEGMVISHEGKLYFVPFTETDSHEELVRRFEQELEVQS